MGESGGGGGDDYDRSEVLRGNISSTTKIAEKTRITRWWGYSRPANAHKERAYQKRSRHVHGGMRWGWGRHAVGLACSTMPALPVRRMLPLPFYITGKRPATRSNPERCGTPKLACRSCFLRRGLLSHRCARSASCCFWIAWWA
jgi:hypothetical protein